MSTISNSKPATVAKSSPKPDAQSKPADKSGKTESTGDKAKVHGTSKSDSVKVTEQKGKVQVEADRFDADKKQLDNAKTIGVKTKAGKDRVRVAGVRTETQSLKLKTGVGNDRVKVKDSQDVGVKTGRGKDRVKVKDSEDIKVSTRHGADRVKTQDTQDTKIKTGRGNDRVKDQGSDGLKLRTGRGNDRVALENTQNAKVRMGKGRDKATLQDVNNVNARGGRTLVNTSETAKNRGRAAASVAAQNARANLDAKMDQQKPSGELAANLDKDGKLTIRGGKGDDNVTLSQQDGQISVRSGDREIANFASDAVNKVVVRTGRGEDEVNLKNIDAAKVRVRTGRGADEVNVAGSENVAVRTGRGKDEVHSVQNENMRIRTGRNADVVTDTASQNVATRTGRGRDQIQMTETLDSKIRGGLGRDKSALTDVDNVRTRSTQVDVKTTAPLAGEPLAQTPPPATPAPPTAEIPNTDTPPPPPPTTNPTTDPTTPTPPEVLDPVPPPNPDPVSPITTPTPPVNPNVDVNLSVQITQINISFGQSGYPQALQTCGSLPQNVQNNLHAQMGTLQSNPFFQNGFAHAHAQSLNMTFGQPGQIAQPGQLLSLRHSEVTVNAGFMGQTPTQTQTRPGDRLPTVLGNGAMGHPNYTPALQNALMPHLGGMPQGANWLQGGMGLDGALRNNPGIGNAFGGAGGCFGSFFQQMQALMALLQALQGGQFGGGPIGFAGR